MGGFFFCWHEGRDIKGHGGGNGFNKVGLSLGEAAFALNRNGNKVLQSVTILAVANFFADIFYIFSRPCLGQTTEKNFKVLVEQSVMRDAVFHYGSL